MSSELISDPLNPTSQDSDIVETSSTDTEVELLSPTMAVVKISVEVEKLREKLKDLGPQEKLEQYLVFMRQQLQPNSTNFRDFWDARRECANLFRFVDDQMLRSQLLEQVQNLCIEAKALKTILDEQSQFAMEQIELAINGMEKELAQVESEHPLWMPSVLPKKADFDIDFYTHRQGILNWLNSFCTRVGALRKELMKTEMRVRSKNKLFSSLSALGDKIFPKRKDLIREISEHFTQDVEHMARSILGATHLHVLSTKDEVKTWQGLAKDLTLNTHAFKRTRESLSECWEHLKKMDKEFQQQRNSQKNERKTRSQHYFQQLEEIKKLHEAGQLPERMFITRLDDLSKKLRKEELMREDQEALRNQIFELKRPIIEREQQERDQRQQHDQAVGRQRDTVVQAVIAKFEQLVSEAQLETISAMQQELRSLQERVVLTHDEKRRLEEMILELKNVAFERQIEELLLRARSTSVEDAQVMLKQLFDLRTQLRQQFEEHKKLAGASGMDFERAMLMSQKARFEKERIERIESAIAELQVKLR